MNETDLREKWQLYFLNKFTNIHQKASLITKDIHDKETIWSVDDMAGHLKDIIEILKTLEFKIDDIQYQLDHNKINPSTTE